LPPTPGLHPLSHDDNVIQPEVQSVAATTLVAAFAGTMSTQEALQKMQDALMALPADRRSTSYK